MLELSLEPVSLIKIQTLYTGYQVAIDQKLIAVKLSSINKYHIVFPN